MKSLVVGLVAILLLGIGGFIYRNVMETTTHPAVVACTEEAKICPDGTSVGRVSPSCSFAPCPFPNAEVAEAGIAFVIPQGYVADENAYGADPSMLAAFVKPSASGSVSHTIIIRRYSIPEGKTANDVILEHTRYQPADMQAEDFSRFETTIVNGRQFRSTTIERFEALVESAYYLERATDVLKFTVIEHDVTEWMNPDLVVAELPEHRALITLLTSLASE